MTEEADILAQRKADKATWRPESGDKPGKGTISAQFSQLSTQEVSHKSSYDDLTDLPSRCLSVGVLFSELAFPTGKLSQKISLPCPKASRPLYQCLSTASATAALQQTSDLNRVFETLERDLEPVDVRAAVAVRKPHVTIGLPKTSSLFRARKTR